MERLLASHHWVVWGRMVRKKRRRGQVVCGKVGYGSVKIKTTDFDAADCRALQLTDGYGLV